jgi:cobalt/nickel transport system ATP-binding protein
MSHHIVEAKGLRYSFPDGNEVLKGVDFRITHGESVAVVGGNGAGKTTLLLHLNGYYLATAGQVRVGDVLVEKGTLDTVRSAVGMVFQDPDDQLFMPTVRDDVAFGPLNMGVTGSEVDSKVEAALEKVGMLHLADKPPYKLSQGEKRAAAIASVLSMQPDILVMDEPSSGLDPVGRGRLLDLLESFEHTKIIATHDYDLAREICDRVIVIMDGQVSYDGAAETLFADNEAMQKMLLASPRKKEAGARPASARSV